MTDAPRGRVLIVSGPSGSGKSTVARLVATDAARPTVHLHTDTFFGWIRTGAVAPWLPESARQNEVVVAAYLAAVIAYARGGYDVVVDGVVGPWFLPPFDDATAEAGLELSYVVLRPDLGTTLARAAARGADELSDPDAIRGLHAQFAALGDLERHAHDSTGRTAERTASEIRDLWQVGELRRFT